LRNQASRVIGTGPLPPMLRLQHKELVKQNEVGFGRWGNEMTKREKTQ
jgi:hypothetical protein